jgi:hypothetical protein
MLEGLIQWRERRTLARRARALAKNASVSLHPEWSVAWTVEPREIGSGEYVVAICHGEARPPSRSWWGGDVRSETVEEMTEKDAQPYVSTGPWR